MGSAATNFFYCISSNERSYYETYKSKILSFSDVSVKNTEDDNPPFFEGRPQIFAKIAFFTF